MVFVLSLSPYVRWHPTSAIYQPLCSLTLYLCYISALVFPDTVLMPSLSLCFPWHFTCAMYQPMRSLTQYLSYLSALVLPDIYAISQPLFSLTLLVLYISPCVSWHGTCAISQPLCSLTLYLCYISGLGFIDTVLVLSLRPWVPLPRSDGQCLLPISRFKVQPVQQKIRIGFIFAWLFVCRLFVNCLSYAEILQWKSPSPRIGLSKWRRRKSGLTI